MTTMRERLIEKLVAIVPNHIGTPEDDQAIDPPNAAALVDAILEELREPDERMVDAGSADASTIPERYAASVAFTAMIDAIRGEKA